MSEFVDNLNEVFTLSGPIPAKRMFGGHGIYHKELMFGLVADDVLYLKADKQSVNKFIEQGLEPFEYDKKGKKIQISYYMAPEEIFDDPELSKEWAEVVFEAALRGRKGK